MSAELFAVADCADDISELADAIVRDLGALRDGRRLIPADSECWCGERSRGAVGAAVDATSGTEVPGHLCLECSADHCRHATLERRCTFALCTREAEVEILLTEAATSGERVCSIHVAPVINWGVIDVDECRIRPLSQDHLLAADETGETSRRYDDDNPPSSGHGAVA